jgi:hypothetical protein
MMDQWTDRLSDYLDGELGESERGLLEQHLSECLGCRRTLSELREVVARAGSLEDREPEADLWPAIAGQIGVRPAPSELKVIDLSAHRVSKQSRKISFSIPQLAAASIALILLSGSLVWFALGRTPATLPVAIEAPNPDVVQVSAEPAALTDYAEAVRSLELALKQLRNRLDPVTVAVLEENLRAIDAAITEARAALERDPNSLYLNQHLENTMKKKIQLLRRAAALEGATI